MRAFLILNLKTLRAKYWLIPGVMALGAMILGLTVVALDRYLGDAWIEELPWIFANEPTGARSVLSTIAGSMITVAGVTFSITIAALATTASSFGPRLISNFMQDRGNQITLGTFIATFLFCVIVLRTVRSEDEALTSFVPHVGIFVALLLAIASLGLLIYFIHHIPESIHISKVVARLGKSLIAQVHAMFPDSLGDPAGGIEKPADIGPPGLTEDEAVAVRARSDGYVVYIDTDGLMDHAGEHDLLVEIRRRPGDFASAGHTLALVRPKTRATEEALSSVQSAIVIGDYQSQQQDVLYTINRLVEVAARALSPGVNDLFTATNAIDWMSSGLASLAGRKVPEDARRDEDGELRIIAHSRTFEEVAAAIFDQLRPYVAGDRNAAGHFMRALASIGAETGDFERRALLLTHAKALHHAARQALDHPRDVEFIEAAYSDAVAALSAPRAGAPVVAEPEQVEAQLP